MNGGFMLNLGKVKASCGGVLFLAYSERVGVNVLDE
jgi:hypothetical protein